MVGLSRTNDRIISFLSVSSTSYMIELIVIVFFSASYTKGCAISKNLSHPVSSQYISHGSLSIEAPDEKSIRSRENRALPSAIVKLLEPHPSYITSRHSPSIPFKTSYSFSKVAIESAHSVTDTSPRARAERKSVSMRPLLSLGSSDEHALIASIANSAMTIAANL